MPREAIDLTPPVEKAFLLAVDTGDDAGWTAEESLTELANLATTAGADVVGAEWQNRRHADPNWYVGKGKAEELLQAKSETGFDIDRKSTRLNSSHVEISYAVFCLKKKKKRKQHR